MPSIDNTAVFSRFPDGAPNPLLVCYRQFQMVDFFIYFFCWFVGVYSWLTSLQIHICVCVLQSSRNQHITALIHNDLFLSCPKTRLKKGRIFSFSCLTRSANCVLFCENSFDVTTKLLCIVILMNYLQLTEKNNSSGVLHITLFEKQDLFEYAYSMEKITLVFFLRSRGKLRGKTLTIHHLCSSFLHKIACTQ